jgi:hypothetical protein
MLSKLRSAEAISMILKSPGMNGSNLFDLNFPCPKMLFVKPLVRMIITNKRIDKKVFIPI